ncbi:MAG: peptide chain release factor N(5)-glutamine methyltransferase [Planctomycetota bacterium]|nr:peptide chain release factor N(5)-glutamine methyltransferase [Planctomycetota bacterium]
MNQEHRPNKDWTARELLEWTEGYFRRQQIPSARLDAEILLAKALGVDRLALLTKEFEELVDEDCRAAFRELVKRRGKKEPVAYLTGEKEFYSLPFEVSPAVLTPRPETEHLVDEALALSRELPGERLRILDLGAGSGNISVALAVNAPAAEITAVDISPEALEVARRNAEKNKVEDRISFLEGDLFDALPSGGAPFDLVVSNPPYIAAAEEESLMDDVRLFEPRIALIDSRSSDGDGLGFFRAICEGLESWLSRSGAVIVETGESQAAKVGQLFQDRGFGEVSITRDYAKIPRIVCARREKEANSPRQT